MALPVVAIVGRPNVGKSSLFNWVAGRRIAIVDPTAGTTRDRLSTLVKAGERYFELVDTGGMGIEDRDALTKQVEDQIAAALASAAVVLFVVDARAGVAPLDELVAERLRQTGKPVLLLANKCDTAELEHQTAELHGLGHGQPIPVSAHQGRGRDELRERLLAVLPPGDEEAGAAADMKVAIVGRRNTGKSTFINCLADDERVIVSEVPGTTRDSVDVTFERDGRRFIAIDTAGVRKKRSLADDIDFYSLHRAERSIRRADVVLLFLDASKKISRVDKQLAEYVLENYKPAVFAVNKWDLLRPLPTGKFVDYLRASFPNLDYVPVAFLTAKGGRNVVRVLNLAQVLYKQAGGRVSTGDLNRVLRAALAQQQPPMRQNRRPKIFFATQISTRPPTIVLFTNGPELFDETYQRYLLKTFRDTLPFPEVPIRLHLRHRHGTEGPSLEDPEGRDEAAEDGEEAAGAGRQGAKGARERGQREPRGRRGRRKDKERPSRLWHDL